MNFIRYVLGITGGHISNFFKTKFGIIGSKYGELPDTNETALAVSRATEEPVAVADAMQTAQVHRFISHLEAPSYKMLYIYKNLNQTTHIPKKVKKTLKEYPKDLDTTQSTFIVIKENDDKYIVHVLFTRETRTYNLRGKMPTILLRVLYLERFKFGSQPRASYICVGTLDANNNRDQNQTGFHQDAIPMYFISDPLEDVFNRFITDLFNQPRFQSYFPECGFLDFQTRLRFLAATTARDQTNELFSLVPGPEGNFAPFFAYLNSLISHATPDYIELADIVKYYELMGQLVPEEVSKFVEKYNNYLEILRENKRKFRRCLLSFTDLNPENLEKVKYIIQQFKNSATVTIEDDIITKKLENENLEDENLVKTIYDEETNLFNNDQFLNDPDRKNIDLFVYMEKTFETTSRAIVEEPPNLNHLKKLKDDMFVSTGEMLLVDRDTGMATSISSTETAGGKSKRNKSKRKNTRKKYYFKKRRNTILRKQNKRRQRKSKKQRKSV